MIGSNTREGFLLMSDEINVSSELKEAVDKAFDIGATWLQEDIVLFLLHSTDGKQAVSTILNCKNQDEVFDKIRKWASDPKTTADWFIQMSTSYSGEDTGIYSLVAHCVERGQKHGFMLLQAFKRNENGKLVPNGDIDFDSSFPNDYFPPLPDHAMTSVDPICEIKAFDFVVTNQNGGLDLVLTDPCIERDPEKRLEILLGRLTSCLRYVHSESFATAYPGVPMTQIRINVVCARPPTDKMLQIKNVSHPAHNNISLPVLFEELPLK
jgi:hypothetical protein